MRVPKSGSNLRDSFQTELSAITQGIAGDLNQATWFLPKAKKLLNKILDSRRRMRDLFFLLGNQHLNETFALPQQLKHDELQVGIILASLNFIINIHDQVVDGTQPNKDNETLILLGDYFHTQTLKKLAELNNFAVLQLINHASQKMNEAEALLRAELEPRQPDFSAILEAITVKTAFLFEVGIAAILKLKNIEAEKFYQYSQNFGRFYITHDLYHNAARYQNLLGAILRQEDFRHYLSTEIQRTQLRAAKLSKELVATQALAQLNKFIVS